MNSKISVIIPIYNVEQYIHECMNSVMNQTYTNLEIILVDDGSTDNCPAICDEYAMKDSRIKVIHKENGGLSDARNAGLEIATGKYIGYVDSDDYIALDMYECLYKACEENDAEIAVCRFHTFTDQVQLSENVVNRNKVYSNQEILSAYIDETVEELITPSAWSKLYRKDCIQGLEFPKGKLCEDIVYTTKAFYNAAKVIYVGRELYFYRNRPGSIMTDKSVIKRRIREEIEQYESRIAFLKDKEENQLVELCCYELYKRMQLRYCEVMKSGTKSDEIIKELSDKMRNYRSVSKKVAKERQHRISYKEKFKMSVSLYSPGLYCWFSRIV